MKLFTLLLLGFSPLALANCKSDSKNKEKVLSAMDSLIQSSRFKGQYKTNQGKTKKELLKHILSENKFESKILILDVTNVGIEETKGVAYLFDARAKYSFVEKDRRIEIDKSPRGGPLMDYLLFFRDSTLSRLEREDTLTKNNPEPGSVHAFLLDSKTGVYRMFTMYD